MKQQLILLGGGVAIILALFVFGKTSEPAKPKSDKQPTAKPAAMVFNIKDHLNKVKSGLTPANIAYITDIENSVSRGDVQAQQLRAMNAMATYWKDTIRDAAGWVYYVSEAAKLDNSEKNLTFAARLTLDQMRMEHDPAKSDWMAETAISLFEKVIGLNPGNDDARVGLGACYIYGKGRTGDASQTMKGIQQVLEVVKKDSNNMQAQLVLGAGGFISGQFDKAIPRLLKVATAQPDNFEAVTTLADCYANLGDNKNAVKWYLQAKRLNQNPAFLKEVDLRIKELQ